MVILDLILLLILGLCVANGARRGLALTLCGLVSILVALAGAKVAADFFSPAVEEIIAPRISSVVEVKLEKGVEHALDEAGDDAQKNLNGILSLFGGNETYDAITDQIQSSIQSGLAPGLQTAQQLAHPIAWWAVFVVAFFLVQLLWNLVSKALNLVAKLPVLNLFNRLMGGGLGLLKGLLIVGIISIAILRFGLVTSVEGEESVFLQFVSTISNTAG